MINKISKALVEIRTFSAKQLTVINAIIAHYDAAVAADTEGKIDADTRKRYAARKYRRVEILNATRATSDKTCNPYFISKNVFLHDATSHLFNLAKAKAAPAPKAKAVKAPKAAAELPAAEAVALIEA